MYAYASHTPSIFLGLLYYYRCGTTCLIMVLCLFYPKWLLLFQFVVVLDISSHWIQVDSSVLEGKTSFKVSGNPIIRLYYSWVCAILYDYAILLNNNCKWKVHYLLCSLCWIYYALEMKYFLYLSTSRISPLALVSCNLYSYNKLLCDYLYHYSCSYLGLPSWCCFHPGCHHLPHLAGQEPHLSAATRGGLQEHRCLGCCRTLASEKPQLVIKY